MVDLVVDMCVVVGALTPFAVGEWVLEFVRSRRAESDRPNQVRL